MCPSVLLADTVFGLVIGPILFKQAEFIKIPAQQKRIMFPFITDCGMRHFTLSPVIIVPGKNHNGIRQTHNFLKGLPFRSCA